VPRINLPAGCAGFADGDSKWMANKPGGFVNLDETDPRDAKALQKLKNQDYASAGLVDAGPEKAFIMDKRKNGRWCPDCLRMWQGWTRECKKCGNPTVPESEVEWPKPPVDKLGIMIL
jgi:hypothetical protein